MTAPTVTVRVDWFNVGDFAGPYDDVSAYVDGDEELMITAGRSADFATDARGSCSFTLRNADHRFSPDRNWCDNPSFERNADGWRARAITNYCSAAASVARQAGDAPSGAGSACGLIVMDGSTPDQGVAYEMPYQFRPGVAYRITLYIRQSSGSGQVQWHIGNPTDGSSNAYHSGVQTITGSWAQKSFSWTPSAEASSAIIVVSGWGITTQNVRIDAVQVNPGNAANAYIEAPTRGQLLPGSPVHVYANDGTDHPQFYGFVQRIAPSAQIAGQVAVTCYDVFQRYGEEPMAVTGLGFQRSVRECRKQVLEEFERGDFNLLANPAFVANTNGWEVSGGTLTRITGDAPWATDETTCAQAIYTGTGYVLQALELQPRYPSGYLYCLSFYARWISGLAVLSASVAASTVIVDRNYVLTASWQRFQLVFELPSDRDAFSFGNRITIALQGQAGQVYRIAALAVTRGPQLRPYARTGAGRPPNLVACSDFDRSIFGWYPAFRNLVGNPSFEADTSGWSIAGDAFVGAAYSLTRVVGGAKFGTARADLRSTVEYSIRGAYYAISGTFKAGHRYLARIYTNNGPGQNNYFGIGSNGTPADKSEKVFASGAWGAVKLNWVPTADRSDVHVYVGLFYNYTMGIDGILVTEVPYDDDYFDTGPQGGGEPATAQYTTDAGRSVLAIACTAIAKSGMAYFFEDAKARFVGGRQYEIGLDLRANVPVSVRLGCGVNKGDGTFDEAGATVSVTTSYQRFTFAYTPAATYVSGSNAARSYLTIWATGTSAPIIYVDAVRVAPEATAAEYEPSQWALGGDAEREHAVGSGWRADGDVLSKLDEINQLALSRHYIRPTMNAPWYQYVSVPFDKVRSVAEQFTAAAAFDLHDLHIDRASALNVVPIIRADGQTEYYSDDQSVRRLGARPAGEFSGELFYVSDNALPDAIGAALIARYRWGLARPIMGLENRYASQVARELDDLVEIDHARLLLYRAPFLIVRITHHIRGRLGQWRTTYQLEATDCPFTPSTAVALAGYSVGGSTAAGVLAVNAQRALAGVSAGVASAMGNLSVASQQIYGPAFNGDTLANVRIGTSAQYRCSYRFRAKSTTLQSLRWYLVSADSGDGYGKGDGGIIRVSVQTDDETPNHFPSGVILTSYTYSPIGGLGIANLLTTFVIPATLTSGQLYHIVWDNLSADYTNNYCSVDPSMCWDVPTPRQPRYGDDWAVIYRYGTNPWEIVTPGDRTPVMDLGYADGSHDGFGYIQFYPYAGQQKPIGGSTGNDKARMTFTVTGGSKLARNVHVRLQRASGTGDLTIRLETGAGSEIETVTLPYDTFPLGTEGDDPGNHHGWGVKAFVSPRVLTNGQTYHLVLSAPSGTTFRAELIRKGNVAYGYSPSIVFTDGYAQYSTNGGSSWTDCYPEGEVDVQFYFD